MLLILAYYQPILSVFNRLDRHIVFSMVDYTKVVVLVSNQLMGSKEIP